MQPYGPKVMAQGNTPPPLKKGNQDFDAKELWDQRDERGNVVGVTHLEDQFRGWNDRESRLLISIQRSKREQRGKKESTKTLGDCNRGNDKYHKLLIGAQGYRTFAPQAGGVIDQSGTR